jgi:hypothetical protein
MDTKKQNKEHPKSCIIANPIYDVVFEKFMESKRIAKFFFSTILEQKVVSVDRYLQRFTLKKGDKFDLMEYGYFVYTMCFIVTILTEEGTREKIPIEVMKSWDEEDLGQLSYYFEKQYEKVDKINEIDLVLPVTTIYFLGFNLQGIENPCVHKEQKNKYIGMDDKEQITIKNHFIDNLPDNSYIIQPKKIINDHDETQLDKLFRFFKQDHFVQKTSQTSKRYTYQSTDKDVLFIASFLQKMFVDPQKREEIESEEENLQMINFLFKRRYGVQQSGSKRESKIIKELKLQLEEILRQNK